MKKVVLLVLLACVCVLPAHATTVTLTFIQGGINPPYNIEINGVPPPVPMICYSDTNGLSPSTWTALVLNVGADLSAVVGTKFGESTLALTIAEYNELGHLANLLFANPSDTNLEDAVWAVSGNLGSTVCNATCQADVVAAAAFAGVTSTDLFYVPVDGNGVVITNAQQPLIREVPEPGALLMLGSGLLGLIGFGVRRRSLVG